MDLDESSFTLVLSGTRRIWEPISLTLQDNTGSPTPFDATWAFVLEGSLSAPDTHKGSEFVPGLEHLGQKVRVSVLPKIGNYAGKPILKEVGVVRPPEEFAQLVSVRLAGEGASLGCWLDGNQQPCRIGFKGPILKIVSVEDAVVCSADLRTLHAIISEGDNSLRIREEASNQEVVLLHFGERRTRDLAHLKIATWMSYLETLKTNKVSKMLTLGLRS